MIRFRCSPRIIRRFYSDVLPKSQSPLVTKLNFFNSVNVNGDGTPIPTFRVLDGTGNLIEGSDAPKLDEATARKIYETMLVLPTLDTILYNVQRQGKISFYMTAHGEEATIIGSAAALANNDEVFGQYREMGVLLWRGFGIDGVIDQCIGNEDDTSGKGKQMPVHLGSTKHHFHTISSPLATQIPQAAGAAYALALSRPHSTNPTQPGAIVDGQAEKPVAVCYFGEGAASEGDFHAGMLLASTIPSPVVFIARNNGFAISTPSNQQYFGDGIASRGPGYGIDTIRVDGNDVLAVLSAVREARKRCEISGRAVLVECMTYRVGHHSTSDDSFAYRQRSEVEDRKHQDNPVVRFRNYITSQGWWSEAEDESTKKRLKDEALQAFKRAEAKPRARLGELFEDAYAPGDMPWNLREQKAELAKLLNKYGNSYEPWKKELGKFRDAGKDVMSFKD